MPRLLGKSSKAPLYVGTALVIVVAALSLEYFGVVDVVPNFGKSRKIIGQSKDLNTKAAHQSSRSL